MSRTYRRKNATWDIRAYDWVWVENDNSTYLERKNYGPNTPEYKKQKVEFHQDKRRYGSGVPSWFVTLYCEKSFRQKTKKEIYSWMKNPENRECMPPVFIRDAGWLYW